MYCLLSYDFVEDVLERRQPWRADHLAHVQAYVERGEVLLAGALADPADGAVIVFKVESRKAVEAFAAADPYVQNGLVTDWRVRAWAVVLGAAVGEDS